MIELTAKEAALLLGFVEFACDKDQAFKFRERLPRLWDLLTVTGVEDVPQSLIIRVRELIRGQKKIMAIKLVREHTGWSLKEAKEFCDRVENELDGENGF